MRRMLTMILVIAGLLGADWGRAPVLAQDAMAGHPLVGSWLVEVEFAGEPPLRLPNLASFTADGIVTVAAPALLPETPASGSNRDLFSAGHGAWSASGERGADVRFVFLVVDARGNPASINIIDGSLEVGADGASYTGTFTLTIASAAPGSPATTGGTWEATRIVPGSGPLQMPAAVEIVATPTT